jgi:hypothetical protein
VIKSDVQAGPENDPMSRLASPHPTANLSGLALGCIEADFAKKNASCSIVITTFAPLQTQKHFFCSSQFIDKIWPFAERCRLVAKISLPIFSELCRKCGKSQVIAGGRCIFEECPARISPEIDFQKKFATKTGRNN